MTMRPWTLVVLLATPALIGCLGGDGPDDGTDPLPPEGNLRFTTTQWKSTFSEVVYPNVVSRIHYIEAKDGTQLSLTVHMPDGLPASAQAPTLVQLTPYQAGRIAQPDGTTTPAGASWSDWVRYGGVYVEADARGTNGSAGCLDFGGTKDREDAITFVEWIRAQPWSNGKVVFDGVSHPGMAVLVAHAAEPTITAGLAHAPVTSYYLDQWIRGARLEQINEFYQAIETMPAFYLDPQALQAQAAPCTGETLLDFGKVEGPFTAKWADRDLSRHVKANGAPILITHGFIDLNVHPDHAQLYWEALPDDYPKYMVLGWWYHGWPDMDGHPAEAFVDWRHRWLDATLFDVENGLWAEPRVLVEDSKGVWHEGDQWPLEPSEWVTWMPTADGALAATADEGAVSYNDPPPGEAERGTWTDAHVAFRSEPLTQDMLVNGAPEVKLVASSNVDATKWVVYLLDEAPDGSWDRISHGYADSHWWKAEDQWTPMVPGTAYTWDIQLFPTAVVVEKGHRITLLVTSQDANLDFDNESDCFSDHRGGCYRPTGIVPAETAGRATNTVHLGATGTKVSFAWVDPGATAKPPE